MKKQILKSQVQKPGMNFSTTVMQQSKSKENLNQKSLSPKGMNHESNQIISPSKTQNQKNLFQAFMKGKEVNSTKNSNKSSFFQALTEKTVLSREVLSKGSSKPTSKLRKSSSKRALKKPSNYSTTIASPKHQYNQNHHNVNILIEQQSLSNFSGNSSVSSGRKKRKLFDSPNNQQDYGMQVKSPINLDANQLKNLILQNQMISNEQNFYMIPQQTKVAQADLSNSRELFTYNNNKSKNIFKQDNSRQKQSAQIQRNSSKAAKNVKFGALDEIDELYNKHFQSYQEPDHNEDLFHSVPNMMSLEENLKRIQKDIIKHSAIRSSVLSHNSEERRSIKTSFNANTKSRNSGNQNLMQNSRLGQTAPLIQNWQSTTMNIGTNSTLSPDNMGAQSYKNLHQTIGFQSQNSLQSQSSNKIKNKPGNKLVIKSNGQFAHKQSVNLNDSKQDLKIKTIQKAVMKRAQEQLQQSLTGSFHQNQNTTNSSRGIDRISPIKDHDESIRDYDNLEILQKMFEEQKLQIQEKCKQLQSSYDSKLRQLQIKYLKIKDQDDQMVSERLQITKKVFMDLGQSLDLSVTKLIENLLNSYDDCVDYLHTQKIDLHSKYTSVDKSYQQSLETLERTKIELEDLTRNELESRSQIQSMAQQIDQRDDVIEKLEYDLQMQKQKFKDLFKKQMSMPTGSKSGLADKRFSLMTDEKSSNQLNEEEVQELIEQLQNMQNENDELKGVLQEMQDELDYEQGLPISDVFENEIKDIPTTRFSNQFDDEYKQLYHQLKVERQEIKDKKKARKGSQFGVDKFELQEGQAYTERVFSTHQKKSSEYEVVRAVNYNSKLNTNESRQRMAKQQSKGGSSYLYADSDQMSILMAESVIFNTGTFVEPSMKPQKVKRPSIVPKLDILKVYQNKSETAY
eukprot:403364969